MNAAERRRARRNARGEVRPHASSRHLEGRLDPGADRLSPLLLVVPSFLAPATVGALERQLPSFLPVRPIVLGLDLQGGAHLLMEVDSASVIKAQVEALRDDVRGKLREGKISISGGIAMQPRGVIVRIADAAERAKALELLQSLNQPIGGALIGRDRPYARHRRHRRRRDPADADRRGDQRQDPPRGRRSRSKC